MVRHGNNLYKASSYSCVASARLLCRETSREFNSKRRAFIRQGDSFTAASGTNTADKMLSTWISVLIGIVLFVSCGSQVISDKTTIASPIQTDQREINITEIAVDSSIVKNIVIKGHTDPWIKANIDVTQPTNLDFSCKLTGLLYESSSITGFWRKDGKQIPQSRVVIQKKESQYHLQIKFQVTNNSQLGNYTCVFDIKPEVAANFVVEVPDTEGREKPLVCYEGDAVVMICKSHEFVPNTWIWHKVNGTEKAIINATANPDRYKMNIYKDGNKTSLKVMGLTGKDSGLFGCSAVYEIGSSEGHVKVKVLSYMVPLKPFLAIATEVIILVSLILVYERHTKKKKNLADNGTEHMEKLKTEESNGVGNSTTRHRNV
ncbi:embigin-like [Acipenser oxyrinchus oxyrinchus]|uniref:Embigin-like n=1 Tax=Acipenser oxyrinchus oxyrinchus TaxID=40147 RepID=A0AAD8GL93_ACIOX|nr:embigin-like [Acipenser oxyrinchus oxyrinchus]